MKKCPMCAEEIQDEARKCKHCGEYLEEPKSPPPSVQAKPEIAAVSEVYSDDKVKITDGAVTYGGITYQIKQLENITVTELSILGKIFLWLGAAFFGFFGLIMLGSISEYPIHFFVPSVIAAFLGYCAYSKVTVWRVMAKQGFQEPTLYESEDKEKVEKVAEIIRNQM